MERDAIRLARQLNKWVRQVQHELFSHSIDKSKIALRKQVNPTLEKIQMPHMDYNPLDNAGRSSACNIILFHRSRQQLLVMLTLRYLHRLRHLLLHFRLALHL